MNTACSIVPTFFISPPHLYLSTMNHEAPRYTIFSAPLHILPLTTQYAPQRSPAVSFPDRTHPPPFQVNTRTTHVPVVTNTYAPHTPNTTLITLFSFICQSTKKQQSTLTLDNKHTHTHTHIQPRQSTRPKLSPVHKPYI